MRRVPTHYADLEEIIGKNPGHVIGSTACLGGFLPSVIVAQKEEPNWDCEPTVNSWLEKMQNIFGTENFYLEMQPPAHKNNEQDYVNQYLYNLAIEKDIPYIITTDSHYLKKADASLHKAYLNSQDGEREVDSFYATTYMMDTQELEKYFSVSPDINMEFAYQNIQHIADQCEDYDLTRPLKIPQLKWKSSNTEVSEKWQKLIPMLSTFISSDYPGDKLLAQLLVEKIESDPRLQEQKIYDAVEECLNMTWESSIINKTHWSAYFLNLQCIVEECWNADTIVGAGRGSGVGFILLYLLDIVQINPQWETTKTFAWRFLNPSRVSVLDVDVDIEGSRRAIVLDRLRKVYGEDRVANVLTLGTEKAKSAILTAARGIGMDVDEARNIAAMVPEDRGQARTLKQCFYGDAEAGYKPISSFVATMKANPQLWELAQRIEGLVCRIGIHAGGVIFVDEPFTNSTSLMRAPDGTIIVGYDLHTSEACSLIKYDLLSVEALDKIHICLDLLRDYGYIEDGSLKERYEKTIGIYNLDRTSPDMWKMVWEHKILSLFQMEKQSGIKGIATLKPASVDELAVLNSTIRLMAQEGQNEMPTDKLARFKNSPEAWDKELELNGLGPAEKKILQPVLQNSYGLCITQEQFMELVQLPELGGFSLTFADSLRKAIAKKNPAAYDKLTEEFYETTAKKHINPAFAKYVWDVLIAMSRGYGFNASHTLAYSLIGLQEMNLAYRFPIIFWNCACLINDSGNTIIAEDSEDEDNFEENIKTQGTDYTKLARGISKMKDEGVNISLVDINKSQYTFVPDVENNTIWCGLKSLLNVNDELVYEIIKKRPYTSPQDFLMRVKPKRQAMISLIKGGAFDEMMDRKKCMAWYIWTVCDKKSRITLQNMPSLMKYNLVPEDTQEFKTARRIYEFNRYLKAVCREKAADLYYTLDTRAINFLTEIGKDIYIETRNQELVLEAKRWDKQVYQPWMDVYRKWIKENHDTILQNLNDTIFLEDWRKAVGKNNYSAWEMEVLCFYYHEHELSNMNFSKYGIVNFNSLPEEPIIEHSYYKGNYLVNIYKLSRICGTCIAKNKSKSIVTVLTPTGVVDVKFPKEYFTLYDKQISEKQPDGTKKVMERSFFNRGNMIMVLGMRRDNLFISKKYANMSTHQLYKIEQIEPNGDAVLRHDRYKGEMEEDDG